MGTDFCLVNRSKKERITFAHLPCTKSREITGNPVCAAIVTYYLIENAGDEIFFVSEHDFEEHKEVHAFAEVTDQVVTNLIEAEILQDDGIAWFDEDEPQNIYIRNLKNVWMQDRF